MTTTEKINQLLKARNILHAQEEGKEVTSLDITMAHDIIDIVIDDMVDEEFHEEMKSARNGMEAPQIQIYERASAEQVELISNINWLLNGAEHVLEQPIMLHSEGGFKTNCTKVLYRDNRIYAESSDERGGFVVQVALERVTPSDLSELYGQLIDEKF